MYRRFGARVTVIEKGPRLTSGEDEDVSAAIKEILENEGIAIELGATAISFRKRDNGFEVIPREGADPIAGSHLLMAIGRRPNTDDLGLENAGVQTDARGHVIVDDQCRTNVEHIWAMGDCNGRGAFTHTSYNDFEIVAANLLDDDPRRVSDRVPTYALYIDPPLGRAGMTVDQVRKSGRKALVGKRPMTRVGRAVEKGETQGFMKVVVDAETKEILGAAILGVGGDEVVHAILDIMTAKEPYTAHLPHDAYPPDGQRAGADPAAGDEAAGLAARPTLSCRVTSATRRPRCWHVRTSEGCTWSGSASTSVCAPAPSQKPSRLRSSSLPAELFQPAPKPRLTQCMWCCAANTASDVSVCILSPLLAPEFVKPAATLSRQVPLRQRRPVCSANA